jgi:hypothetical protein
MITVQKNTQKYFIQSKSLTMIMQLELQITDGGSVSLLPPRPSRRRVNKCLDTLNITFNCLYCNHQVHRGVLIALYFVLTVWLQTGISRTRSKIFGGIIPVVWSDTGRKLSMYVADLTPLYLILSTIFVANIMVLSLPHTYSIFYQYRITQRGWCHQRSYFVFERSRFEAIQ